jgi:hypothetical protein
MKAGKHIKKIDPSMAKIPISLINRLSYNLEIITRPNIIFVLFLSYFRENSFYRH